MILIVFLLLQVIYSITTVIEAENSVLMSTIGQYTYTDYNYSVDGHYLISTYMFNNKIDYDNCINTNYTVCEYCDDGSIINKSSGQITNFYCDNNCYLLIYNHYKYFVKIDYNITYCGKQPTFPPINDDDQDCYTKYRGYIESFFAILSIMICLFIFIFMICIGYCAKNKFLKNKNDYEILNTSRQELYDNREY